MVNSLVLLSSDEWNIFIVLFLKFKDLIFRASRNVKFYYYSPCDDRNLLLVFSITIRIPDRLDTKKPIQKTQELWVFENKVQFAIKT